MGYLIESFILELFCTVVVLPSLLLYIYFNNKFLYWSNKGVPYIQPVFPFGNVSSRILNKKTAGVSFADLYVQFKQRGYKYAGIYVFAKPLFMPLDPELCKTILVKDFSNFIDRGVFFDEENDPLSVHMLAVEGQQWRKLRTKLSPTFTSGKMKMMFQTMLDSSKELEVILEDMSKKNEPVNVKDISGRFTTDIISSVAFGLECNSLRNPDEEFRKYGRRIFENSIYEGMLYVFSFVAPGLFKSLKLSLTKPDVTKFFTNAIKQTVEYREANQVDRKDMMSLLLKLKNNQSIDDEGSNEKTEEGLTFNELAAQCFIFYLAGFETSSATTTFVLFELCQNQHVQNKLREEIHTVLSKYEGKITYEAVIDMTYMDKVINETLRKFPPVPFLNRMTKEPWRIPGTDVVLDKGTSVVVSNYGMHKDPEYFPNPELFDPERFSDENKYKRHAYSYMPFGEGPRSCVGTRFGLLQTKVALTIFLKDYKFDLHPKTTLPVQFDVNSIILNPKYGMWLKTTKI